MRRVAGALSLALMGAACSHGIDLPHDMTIPTEMPRPKSQSASNRLHDIATAQREQDVDFVIRSLTNADADVRAAAGFAAGQYGMRWQPLPDATLDHIVAALLAASPTPSEEVATALGKLGRSSAVPTLLKMLDGSPPDVQRDAAIALGRIAYATKGAAPGVEAIDPLTSILLHSEPGARYGAAYALMRIKRPEARAALTYGIKDGDPLVRAVCARGLADVAEDTELPYLLERLGDPGEGVRVEAARSLGKLAAKCPASEDCQASAAVGTALDVLVKAFVPDQPQTAMALLALAQEKLPSSDEPALAHAFSALPAGDSRARREVACWLASAHDRTLAMAATPLLDSYSPGDDLLAWKANLQVHTLADSLAAPASRAAALLRLQRLTPQVSSAVDDALGDLGVDSPEVRARLLFDLDSPDYTVALSAVDAARKLKLAEAVPLLPRALALAEANFQDDGMATVFSALADLNAPDAATIALRYADDPRPTVRAGALAALATLKATPNPIPEPRPRLQAPTDAPPLDRERRAHVKTSRGEIVIELEAGSHTAGNFAQLARRGFYDGLTWHRVVPDFVVQGGDPRGDGSGGPGYTIPCEIGEQHYVRGTAGMALSGKDTGGSQFFIALSPQPHLEGKYTVFGQVTQGMEVADQLVEGDLIESVRVE